MAYNIKIIDPQVHRVWFAGQAFGTTTAKKAKDWCKEENADLTLNLGVFQMITDKRGVVVAGNGCTYVHTSKGDLGYGGASEILSLPNGDKCKGYSNGVINGVVKINAPMGGSRTRNGIGITTDGFVILAQSGHKCTERAFCNEVIAYAKIHHNKSVKLFLLEDGGGSTSEYSALSNLTFAPEGGRVVTTVVCVKFNFNYRITRPLYKNCPKNGDTALLQMALGGLEVDDSYGTGTGARVKSAYAALGFPSAVHSTVAYADLLERLKLH